MHLRLLRELRGTPMGAPGINELVGDLVQTGCQVLLRISEGIRFGGQL
jgi:hypothetical protein